MRIFVLATVLCLLALCRTTLAQNYCAASLCPAGKRHIACQNTGRFAAKCPANAAIVPMTAQLRQLILRMHNTRRNNLAGGVIKKFQTATRMATMRWDPELAKLATLNVRQCTMKHDACRNTAKFRASGQNLAWIGYSGPVSRRTNAQVTTALINSWWSEKKQTTNAQLRKFPSNYNGPDIGHFTAMARDGNTNVGCAIGRYTDSKWHNVLLACNYATTNLVGSPVYAAGPKASGCRKGRNPKFPNLCAPGEVYSGL